MLIPELITKEDFLSWKDHRVTRAYFDFLDKKRQNICEKIMNQNVPQQDLSQIAASCIGGFEAFHEARFCDEDDINSLMS